jgi:hypothetical protein
MRSVTHARRSSARVHMSGCGALREQGGYLKGRDRAYLEPIEEGATMHGRELVS